MKQGLVIGKFMPVHEGHVALIRFAASQCDQLIVSMSYTPHDPIDPSLRLNWMKAIFAQEPQIAVAMIADDFDRPELDLDARTSIWADAMRKAYPKIDVLVSSEDYGAPFAKHLNAEHIIFDQQRVRVPVSASKIRENPFQNWAFIPAVVRPYFVKKICFYGPESTGKSTMAQKMADKFDTVFVPEVARELIFSNEFSSEDIKRIGYAQNQRVKDKLFEANKLLFCDTDIITTKIYSRHYLNEIPSELNDLEKEIQYDHYFLFDIDVPWVADHLRDLGEHREGMLRQFRDALEQRNITYQWVRGSYEEREQFLTKEIKKILS